MQPRSERSASSWSIPPRDKAVGQSCRHQIMLIRKERFAPVAAANRFSASFYVTWFRPPLLLSLTSFFSSPTSALAYLHSPPGRTTSVLHPLCSPLLFSAQAGNFFPKPLISEVLPAQGICICRRIPGILSPDPHLTSNDDGQHIVLTDLRAERFSASHCRSMRAQGSFSMLSSRSSHFATVAGICFFVDFAYVDIRPGVK